MTTNTNTDTDTDNQKPEDIEYDAHPVFKTAPEESNKKNLSFLELIAQAFCLLFQLQRGKGLKRASDLLEDNPKSIILAGIISMIIFFSFCFITSQLAIKYLTP